MKISVRFFARHREIVGKGEEIMEVPEGSTLVDLIALVERNHPSLGNLSGSVVFGVNREESSIERILRDGDEVVILPPVSGG